MNFFKKLFSTSPNSKDKNAVSESEIQDMTKNFIKCLPGKLKQMNAIPTYTPILKAVAPNKFQYVKTEVDQLAKETADGITLMKELSTTGIIDVWDENIPYTDIRNLDFYYESWQTLQFSTLDGRILFGTHCHTLGQIFGAGMIQNQTSLEWFYKGNKTTGSLVLVDLKKNIEIDPFESIMRCVKRKEQNPFSSLQRAYLKFNEPKNNKRQLIL